MNLIPEDTYLARAKTWTYCKSPKNNWYLSVAFELLASEHAGQRVSGYFNFASDAQCRASYATMQLMGWQGGDPSDCHDNGGGLDANEVEVVVRHSTLGDRVLAKVERVMRPGEGAADREALRQFLSSRTVRPPTAQPPASTSSVDKGNV